MSERAQRRREQSRRQHGGGEDDQRGNEQQERARAAAPGELLRVDGSARPADEHDRDGADRRRVERCEREPSDLQGGRADRREEEEGGGEREHGSTEEPAPREQRVRHDFPRGRAGPGGDGSRHEPAQSPAGDRAERGERGRLGEGEELHLPPARTEPCEASPRIPRVAETAPGGRMWGGTRRINIPGPGHNAGPSRTVEGPAVHCVRAGPGSR